MYVGNSKLVISGIGRHVFFNLHRYHRALAVDRGHPSKI